MGLTSSVTVGLALILCPYIFSKLSTAHQASDKQCSTSRHKTQKLQGRDTQAPNSNQPPLPHLKIVVVVLVLQMLDASHGYKSHDHHSIQPHNLSLHLCWWCSDTIRGIQVERERSYQNTWTKTVPYE